MSKAIAFCEKGQTLPLFIYYFLSFSYFVEPEQPLKVFFKIVGFRNSGSAKFSIVFVVKILEKYL